MKINVFGSCIVRDIFRLSEREGYEIGTTIGRNPISILFSEGENISYILEKLHNVNNFEKKCIDTMWRKDAIKILSNNPSDYLVVDLAEERLEQYAVNYKEKIVEIVKYNYTDVLMAELEKKEKIEYRIIGKRSEKEIEEKYQRFYESVVGTGLYDEKQVILVKTYMTSKYVTRQGTLQSYKKSWNIEERNSYLKMCYRIFEKVFAGCWKIDMPEFVLGNLNHSWGAHPLHYQDSAYKYFADAIDCITGRKKFVTLEKLRNVQSIDNRLYARICGVSRAYEIPELKEEINRILEKIEKQEKEIEQLNKKMKKDVWRH